MFYNSPEQVAKEKAIIAEVTAEFKKDFAALLARYQCEVSVATSSRAYEMTVDGIEFQFDGIYKDGETVRPYFDVNIGSRADKDYV